MMNSISPTLSILMEGEFIQMKNRLPEIIVFAGPNGSGKTTITRMAKTIGVYIILTISKNQIHAVIWKYQIHS